MRADEFHLDALPAPLLDLDVDQWGRCVAICGSERGTRHLVVDNAATELAFECRFPRVRIIDAERALLVDSRCEPRADNAWVLGNNGKVERAFRVGDAVEDVVVIDDSIVVSYFDEAYGAPQFSGVVVFDAAGNPVLDVRDAFGIDVVDCYCICDAGRGRVLFVGYPGFDAVLLDVRAKTHTTWRTPPAVHGAHAVAVAGDTAFFSGAYGDGEQLARWRFGEPSVEKIGTRPGRLRGLAAGRMLVVESDSYTVLAFTEDQM